MSLDIRIRFGRTIRRIPEEQDTDNEIQVSTFRLRRYQAGSIR